jgi:hypothetical protein
LLSGQPWAPLVDEYLADAGNLRADPKPADMAVHGPLDDLLAAPDAPPQFVLAEHPHRVAGELDEELQLQRPPARRAPS